MFENLKTRIPASDKLATKCPTPDPKNAHEGLPPIRNEGPNPFLPSKSTLETVTHTPETATHGPKGYPIGLTLSAHGTALGPQKQAMGNRLDPRKLQGVAEIALANLNRYLFQTQKNDRGDHIDDANDVVEPIAEICSMAGLESILSVARDAMQDEVKLAFGAIRESSGKGKDRTYFITALPPIQDDDAWQQAMFVADLAFVSFLSDARQLCLERGRILEANVCASKRHLWVNGLLGDRLAAKRAELADLCRRFSIGAEKVDGGEFDAATNQQAIAKLYAMSDAIHELSQWLEQIDPTLTAGVAA